MPGRSTVRTDNSGMLCLLRMGHRQAIAFARQALAYLASGADGARADSVYCRLQFHPVLFYIQLPHHAPILPRIPLLDDDYRDYHYHAGNGHRLQPKPKGPDGGTDSG